MVMSVVSWLPPKYMNPVAKMILVAGSDISICPLALASEFLKGLSAVCEHIMGH